MDMSIIRPKIKIKAMANIATSYKQISEVLLNKKHNDSGLTIAIECYPTSNEKLILKEIIQLINPHTVIEAEKFFLSSESVTEMIKDDLTEDRIFGFMSHHNLKDFLD